MHRYYMNAETRDSLIDESKRMIAAARAHRAATRLHLARIVDSGGSHAMPAELKDAEATDTAKEGSAFASLVSSLWAASVAAAGKARADVGGAPAR